MTVVSAGTRLVAKAGENNWEFCLYKKPGSLHFKCINPITEELTIGPVPSPRFDFHGVPMAFVEHGAFL
ncbi:hypothetical protein HZ326_0161 [Fusarium oxysporum f. sp. albedinis]|nr:hypothetical protein HZ326_0161 [Fusarium oxysporum f. sp. albedinis]